MAGVALSVTLSNGFSSIFTSKCGQLELQRLGRAYLFGCAGVRGQPLHQSNIGIVADRQRIHVRAKLSRFGRPRAVKPKASLFGTTAPSVISPSLSRTMSVLADFDCSRPVSTPFQGWCRPGGWRSVQNRVPWRLPRALPQLGLECSGLQVGVKHQNVELVSWRECAKRAFQCLKTAFNLSHCMESEKITVPARCVAFVRVCLARWRGS